VKRTGKTVFDRPVHRNPPPAPVPPPFDLALQLLHRGDLERSKTILDGILRSQPGHADAWHLRGVIAIMAGEYQRGADLIGTAIALQPNNAAFHFNRGNAFKNLGQLPAAVESYDQAIRLRPDHADAYCNRGIALHALRRFDAALESYDRALRLDPLDADSHFNRGLSLHALRQLDAAVASFDRTIQLNPDFPEAYCRRGHALRDAKQWRSAASSYDKAIELKSDYVEAYWNRGHALLELRRFEAALADYDTVARLQPDLDFMFGDLLHARSFFCDWTDYDVHLARVKSLIERGAMVSSPFSTLGIVDSPAIQFAVAETWAKTHHPPGSALGPLSRRDRHKAKIRLGYYSEDFHDHATCHLMAGVFELHDKSRFDLVAFSYGPDVNDAMRQRLLKCFDSFVDVRAVSDLEVTRRSRELGIDIAIDLKGYAPGGRTGIFSERCAPIQVNFLGFPGTMGVDYIDYIVADRTLIPAENRKHNAEKIVYLPDTYQPNDTHRPSPMEAPTRQALGLPAKGFVFCCLNDCYKISPLVFDRWMRILRAVEQSVLWLFVDRDEAAQNLRKEATKRGVDEGRLVFCKRVPVTEHLARYRVADLFLDTLPCNAHTTASEAMWLGLPVLTCMGDAFAARVAASLLNAIDLPEMITTNLDDYESLAIELARNPARLQQVKEKLWRNRLSTPLFDTRLFAKNIEAAYAEMYRRYQEGLPPDHIHIG
jgi:predicted O-linked N-acetylglucosamine transferase (SPINDLY family)